MPKKQKDKKTIQDKRRFSKYLARLVSLLILSALLTVIIGHFWLVPAIVSREVEQGLLKFWDGEVKIEDIEINYFGPIHLGKVKFIDKADRECLQTGIVKMVFEKWPGLHPVVTEIEIEALNWQISAPDGKLKLPVAYPSTQSPDLKKRLDIRKLTVNEAEIAITDAQGTKTLYDHLQLFATKKDDYYDFLLNKIDSGASESLLAKGTVDLNTSEIQLSLQIKHTVKRPEMAQIFAVLDIPKLSAEGKLAADLTITGCLKEPAGLKPNGIISFDGWTVIMKDNIVAKNLNTEGRVKDRRLDFDNITASTCNGLITGSLYIEAKQNQQAEFGGKVSAQKMSFVEVTSLLCVPGKKATRGSVTFNYSFSGKDVELQKLSGEGQIFLDDADINVIPIVSHIFRAIGLAQLDPLKMSDAACTFTTAGPIMTIKSAHIANLFAAIKAEPGGTINLQTGQINMYVIAVPLRQVDAIIGRVPVVNIFANLKDKLTRLHVRGHWSDPPSKLITKEPIKDIKEATVSFIQDVIKNGGQITQEMSKRLGIFSKPKKGVNN